MANGVVIPPPTRDGFEAYYAEKLWASIPAIHRHEDGVAESPGALRALVAVLAQQAAVVRRSEDRLWDDQFVDLCDDWAVPYIGDLVGTRGVSALNRRGARVDVAKTIHYRRRKGTLTVLEELVRDITGWEGTAVETFRRLARTRHRLDPSTPRPGRHSGTPAGGWADMRSQRACELAGGPFDEFHRTPDFRRHRGRRGRYGIPKLALHLFRLRAYAVDGVRPVDLGDNRFTFDPSGREVALFLPATALGGDRRRAAREWELPAPMSCRLLAHAEFTITEEIVQQLPGLTAPQAAGLRRLRGLRLRDERSFDALVADVTGVPALPAATARLLRSRALLPDCGRAALAAVAVRVHESGNVVEAEQTTAADLGTTIPAAPDRRLIVDPERGLFALAGLAPTPPVIVDYVYGSSGEVGAGSYGRRGGVGPDADVVHAGGGAIASAGVANAGVTELEDSATYDVTVTKKAVTRARIQAADQRRPYLRLQADLVLGTVAAANAELVLEGLWLGGAGRVVLQGDYSEVTIRHCTLDPGGTDASGAAIARVPLVVEATIDRLVLESCVLAEVRVPPSQGSVEQLDVHDCVLDARGARNTALAMDAGRVRLERTTVLGAVEVHRLSASEALVTGAVTVTDIQAGCWRFSAAPTGSRLPRPYESATLADSGPLFTSRRFGDPGYAQLSAAVPDDLARGAEDGSEIGAFSGLIDAMKLDGLRAKFDEYLPFGLVPLFIKET